MKINNGYFDDNKQEYVILNMFPRRKLVNYLWNEEAVCSLGNKPTYKGLTIEPCLPSSWNSLEVVRKFRGETYNLHYIRSNENKVECDGKKVDVLPLCGKPSNHDVNIYFK